MTPEKASTSQEASEPLPKIDTQTLATLNRSEIDQQITTAKQYPRSIRTFRRNALDLATLTEEVAQECLYALPREGKVIEGPSVRLAEILASSWGNCRVAARVVEEGMEFVTAQGAFHDLETNSVIQYEVKRRITDKRGRRYSTDMVAVTANAACSIALRNVILRGIPKALWTEVYDAAKAAAVGDVKTMNNRRADLVKAFQAYGVDEARMLAAVEKPSLEDVGLDEIATLRGMFTAIKEGEIRPEEAFPIPKPAEDAKPSNGAPKTLDQFAKNQKAKQELPPHDPETGELLPQVQQEASESDEAAAELFTRSDYADEQHNALKR